MLRSTNKLHGYAIHATDGDIGKVDEFYFDDEKWTIRYLVVDTGSWLTGRRVLLSPAALGQPDWDRRILPVKLTRQQVHDSPDIDTDKPISRRQEIELYKYFGWSAYWVGDPLLGDPNLGPGPIGLYPAAVAALAKSEEGAAPQGGGDPHLESTRDVIGYHIQAADGEIGHVEDFVVDDESWVLRYIVADTRNWLPGKKVLLAPQWVGKVSWAASKVHVDLLRERIRHSPPYHSAEPVTREYEIRLYDYYGRPKYWC